MNITRSTYMGLAAVLAWAATSAQAEERRWDQEKAEAIVQGIIDQEERGDFAWDNIAWETDAEKAAKQAKEEQKPIFVFLFLKKDVGPATAPC